MKSWTMRGVRRGLMLLACGTMFASAAAAQQPARLPPGAVVQPMGRDDGAELRRHLTTLADNPRSIDALIGAGRAALRSGDAEAAFSFFGRADEISPRNARIKAGMASALVQLGRAQPALGLFQQALSLGAPVGEIAGDRGLAFDMLGDPRRAQQDYTLALRNRDDQEVRRRMALSLAISGEREAALRIIDPQLRRNDRAAWRTQAFILALTGDAAGATRTAQGSMPAGAAQAISPFLARLPALSPQQKALAVHLGHFPAGGRAMASAQSNVAADPGALALAMGGAPAIRTASAAAEEPVRTANRRRPGRTREGSGGGNRRRVAANTRDSSDPFNLRDRRSTRRRARDETPAPVRQPEQREVAQLGTRWAGAPVIPPPARTPPPTEQPTAAPPAEPPRAAPPAPQPQPQPVAPQVERPQPEPAAPQADDRRIQVTDIPPAATPTVAVPQPEPAPAAEAAVAESPAATPAAVEETPPASTPAPASAPPGEAPAAEATPGFTSIANETPPAPPSAGAEPLADIASIVEALPQEEAPPPAAAPPAPRPAPARSAPREPAPAATRPRNAQPAHPSRHWVQIAGGANRAGLPRELARLRAQAPELASRQAWTTPLNATNRLLVGPFASSREAQEFVNRLAEREVAAFAWTSPAGQEIHRLTGR